MLNFEVCKESFSSLLQLNEKLTQIAEKNKVSAPALVLLISVYCNNDLIEFFKEEYLLELLNLSFLEKCENSYKLTGKGAIFAKSLERVIDK